jgi:two-component system alkaline phosphatase synthesis response regulator PhoP
LWVSEDSITLQFAEDFMRAEEGNIAAGSKSNGSAPPPRILIADDDLQSVELLEAYLADTGYEVRTATDGEATLREAQQWQPDVILLDIMMPKISGFEVCKRLRVSPSSRKVGILMITALDQSSDVERAVEAGTDDFLTKPINKADLLLRIRSLLKSCQSQSNLDRALAYIEAVERGEK